MLVQLLLPNPHMMMEFMGGCDHYQKQGKFLPTRQSHRGKTVWDALVTGCFKSIRRSEGQVRGSGAARPCSGPRGVLCSSAGQ